MELLQTNPALLAVLVLVLLVCELAGIYFGVTWRTDFESRKRNKFKFLISEVDLLRLDTTTGRVVKITENNEEIIHYGKKIASYINSFDLVQSGEHYIIYDTSTGYSRYLI